MLGRNGLERRRAWIASDGYEAEAVVSEARLILLALGGAAQHVGVCRKRRTEILHVERSVWLKGGMRVR